MTTFKTLTTLTAAAALFTAGSALAAESKTAEAHSKTAANAQTEVRAAIEDRRLVRVVDSDGNVYFNRMIAAEALPDPELNLDTLRTYSYEYEGRTYTNKVVQPQD